MSTVKQVQITSEHVWGTKVQRRYSIVLVSESGSEHSYELPIVIVDSADDGSELATTYLASIKFNEINAYKDSVRSGVNPFTATPAVWNTRAELLYAILKDALESPATDPLVINGLAYLGLVTDAELIAIFGKDQTWVDIVRAEAASLLVGKTVLDAYIPIGVN